MDAYTGFAQVYDLFMDNVPYEEWGRFIKEELSAFGIEDGLVLDMGCGTGRLTRIMSEYGYDMIALDCSPEMLEIAREQSSEDILYLLQDMEEMELYGTVRAIYSVCDCMNYILEEEGLQRVFRLVNNYLDPGGIFLFDINTPWKYSNLLRDNVFAENREEGSFIWENDFDETTGINEYDLTLYIRQDNENYARFQEVHYQRSYTLKKIKTLLEEAGLEYIDAYDAYSHNPIRTDSEKITILARECQKKKGE